jgi:hypothetical protein
MSGRTCTQRGKQLGFVSYLDIDVERLIARAIIYLALSRSLGPFAVVGFSEFSLLRVVHLPNHFSNANATIVTKGVTAIDAFPWWGCMRVDGLGGPFVYVLTMLFNFDIKLSD